MVMQARAEVHFIIDQAIQNMQTLEAQARSTGQTVGTAFNASDRDMASFNQALNTVGRNFMVTGAAITAGVGLAVNSFMSFEQQMDAVGAVSQASVEDMEKLTAAALRIGQETSLNAVEVGAAMEILAKAGVPLQDIYNGVAEGAVRLSEATGVDITMSAETAAAAMTIFNYTAEETDRVMNVIAQSSNASMIGVEDWTTALQYAGPMVATLGYEIEDLAEWMVILGNNGIRGSVAATSLRNILTQLSDSASPARESLDALGISVLDAEGNMKGLDQIITELVPHWDSLDDASKIDFANNAFGVRGGPAFIAMMNAQAEAVANGGDAFDEAGKKMAETGDIYTMSQMRMDNLAGSVERLRGSVETLAINFGSRLAPAIRVGVDMLDRVVDAIANLPGPIQTVIAAVAALSGGGLLLGGSMLLLLPQIMATTEALTKLGGLRGVLSLLVAPIRAIGIAFMGSLGPILLITAAAAALYFAWKHNFLGIRDLIDGFVGWLGDAWGAAQEFFEGVSWLFGGDKKKVDAELDISTNTDDDFKTYDGMGEGFGKQANLDIVSHPDDMFIEYIYGADGTVIGYDVKITSSTDGTEQTGRILSSSKDKDNPDLIHMEVQLESGETVTGTYNEIEGTFSEIPGNVNVGATFVGDAYYVKEETLPDGSKAWNIYEKDGDGAFGAIIESYTGAGGETYILIEGDDGPFWTTIDLATGKIGDPSILTIEGDPSKYNLTLGTIKSATGNEVTVVLNGDGEPVTATINEVIRDPNTGNKWIELTLANGDTWVAEVDGVTGSIQLVRKVELEADTSEAESRFDTIRGYLDYFAGWAIPQGGLLGFLGRAAELGSDLVGWLESAKYLVTGEWGSVDWELIFDMAGLGPVYDLLEKTVDLMKWVHDYTSEKPEPGTTGTASTLYEERQPDGSINPNYHHRGPDEQGRTITGRDASGVYVGASDPYRPNEGSYEELKAMQGIMVELAQAGTKARDPVIDLFDAIKAGKEPTSQTTIDMDLMASAAGYTDVSVMGAARGIESSSGIWGSAFGSMATSVVEQSGLATTTGSTNFGLLSQSIAANSLAAQLSASTNFGALQSTAASRFATMNADTSSKMAAIQSEIATRSTSASTTGSAQFSQLQSSVSSRLSGMSSGVSTQFGSIASTVSAKTTEAKNNAASQFSQMSSSVAGKMLGMQAATALKFATMASDANTQAGKMASNLDTGAGRGVQNVNSQLSKIAGFISGAGAAGAWAALMAGLNIGNSFASGMEAALGRIRAAAAAMVSAAQAAVLAKAMISSPSKVFMELGGYIGEGVEVGILNSIPGVERASERLVHIPELPGGFNTLPGYSPPGSLQEVVNITYNQAYVLSSDEWLAAQDKISQAGQATSLMRNPTGYSQYARRRR